MAKGMSPGDASARDTAIHISDRETKDMQFSLYYTDKLAHGSANHNWMILCAKLAHGHGYKLGPDLQSLYLVEDSVRELWTPTGMVKVINQRAAQLLWADTP